MYHFLEFVACLLVATAMAPAAAHALERPGKMRLDRQHYFVVQQIYYPGFTAAGIAEPAAILATFLLAIFTPLGTPQFWLAAITFLAMVTMQIVFWLMTQPVNRIWVREIELSKSARSFFNVDVEDDRKLEEEDWTLLRDRWERSHLIRAGLAVTGLATILLSVILR